MQVITIFRDCGPGKRSSGCAEVCTLRLQMPNFGILAPGIGGNQCQRSSRGVGFQRSQCRFAIQERGEDLGRILIVDALQIAFGMALGHRLLHHRQQRLGIVGVAFNARYLVSQLIGKVFGSIDIAVFGHRCLVP